MDIIEIQDLLSSLHSRVEMAIRPDMDTHKAILDDAEITRLAARLYSLCKITVDGEQYLEQLCETYGYQLAWARDPVTKYKTDLYVVINTPYGGIELYSNEKAFAQMAKTMESIRPVVDAFNAAEQRGDHDEMRRILKRFRRMMNVRKVIYFLVTPIHALLLLSQFLLRWIRRPQ